MFIDETSLLQIISGQCGYKLKMGQSLHLPAALAAFFPSVLIRPPAQGKNLSRAHVMMSGPMYAAIMTSASSVQKPMLSTTEWFLFLQSPKLDCWIAADSMP